jgi:hypothetical protein
MAIEILPTSRVPPKNVSCNERTTYTRYIPEDGFHPLKNVLNAEDMAVLSGVMS